MAQQRPPAGDRTALEDRLIARATTDNAFRQLLLRDARVAIRQELGITVPDGVQVRVHDETPTELHLVLPAPRTDELSDRELDQVAAGYIPGNDLNKEEH